MPLIICSLKIRGASVIWTEAAAGFNVRIPCAHAMNFENRATVDVFSERNGYRGEAQDELDIDQQEDRYVAGRWVAASARFDHAPVQQHVEADEADQSGSSADHDRHPLLESM